jgi:hypothetical protein
MNSLVKVPPYSKTGVILLKTLQREITPYCKGWKQNFIFPHFLHLTVFSHFYVLVSSVSVGSFFQGKLVGYSGQWQEILNGRH